MTGSVPSLRRLVDGADRHRKQLFWKTEKFSRSGSNFNGDAMNEIEITKKYKINRDGICGLCDARYLYLCLPFRQDVTFSQCDDCCRYINELYKPNLQNIIGGSEDIPRGTDVYCGEYDCGFRFKFLGDYRCPICGSEEILEVDDK